MLSYLSTPYKSTIEPYKENVNLIAQVAQQKQSRYDNLISTVFQQQNQLIDLETLNNKVTDKKNSMLKELDANVNKLAAVDLTIPDNIQKIDNLFTPITNDKDILTDLYYTKQIKENQEFAKTVLKKDPSTGNQINFHTSQRLVDLYKNAEMDQLSEAAPYATMFSPYVDIKAKKMDFLQKIGIIKDGYTNEFETTTQDGIKYYKKQGKLIPESEVLAKFYASLTPEDEKQLVLDGYNDYGNADIKEIINGLQENKTLQLNNITDNLKKINEVIKELDANGDGKVDKIDQDVDTNQNMLNSYLNQKDFYSQKQEMLKNRQSFIDKFNTNGDLNIADRLNLFSSLKKDELAGDMVTLLSQNKPLDEVTKLDFTLVWNLNADLLKEQVKSDAESRKKAKEKEEEEGVLIEYDYNSDGIIDYRLGSNVTNSNDIITEEDLKTELGVEKVKTSSFTTITNEKGEKVPSTKDLSSYNIDNWKEVFNKLYKDKALNSKILADEMITQMSLDNQGNLDEELKNQNQAKYKIHKETFSKLKEDEIQKRIKEDPSVKKFEDLRQLELNLENAGSVTKIHNQIQKFLAEKYGKILHNLPKTDQNALELTKNYLNKNNSLSRIYSDIEDVLSKITITPKDTEIEIVEKILLENNKIVDRKLGHDYIKNNIQGSVNKIAHELKNAMEKVPKQGLAILEKEGQDIYKELISKESFLTLTVSPSGETGKKNDFYASLNTLLRDALSDPSKRTDVKYKDQTGKEKSLPKDIKLPESFTTLTFNTGTGNIRTLLEDMSTIEYNISQRDGQNNGLPFGVPADDLIGKQLILETHLNKSKGLSLKTSSRINIGKTPLGDASIYYDASEGQFKVSYYSSTEKVHKDISNISGSNTRETTMKFYNYLQNLGGDVSNIKNSAYNILNQ